MGVMVDGVEIPIQIGQVWGCAGEEGIAGKIIEKHSKPDRPWLVEMSDGSVRWVTESGRHPHPDYCFVRLLSGPGAPEAQPSKAIRELAANAVQANGPAMDALAGAPQPSPAQPDVTEALRLLQDFAYALGLWKTENPCSDYDTNEFLAWYRARLRAVLSGEPQGQVEKHHNRAGHRCATCDGTYSHYHVYDAHGGLPCDEHGNIKRRSTEPQAPTQGAPKPDYWIADVPAGRRYTDDPEEARFWIRRGFEVTPVYRHPAAPQGTSNRFDLEWVKRDDSEEPEYSQEFADTLAQIDAVLETLGDARGDWNLRVLLREWLEQFGDLEDELTIRTVAALGGDR